MSAPARDHGAFDHLEGRGGATERSARRVLDLSPTALIVVDAAGSVVYANEAMLRLGGWASPYVESSVEMFDFIHDEDAAWIAEAFIDLASKHTHGTAVLDRPWAPVNFRIVSSSGEVLPVEVIGRDAFHEPDVGGIIFEVRSAAERDIFQRVLAGVAMGGDVVNQLELILDLISATPFEIESAVLASRSGGSAEVIVASTPALGEVLRRGAEAGELAPLVRPAPGPTNTAVADLSSSVSRGLTALGLVDAFHVDVAVPSVDQDYRIVVFTPVHHIPALGVGERLRRAAELASVVLLRVRAESMLARAAHHDPLTELPNRLGLRSRVDGFDRGDDGLSVLFVDLDDFKHINDRHGHSTGDRVLRVVAERLTAVTRSTDVIARLGGDEFAVVLGPFASGPKTAGDAAEFADRLLDALASPIVVDGIEHRVSASIGFVHVDSATDVEVAVAGADRAMYVAKRAGGGRVHDGRATGDGDRRA
ncbi:diguanylate cyclase domain-containing protein [Ilumatobacter sp.]|uniref:diguanylate cyclase domain-containing protein n=1 Tax=Ilumatobacter sp. TaxID=1967498 RepID=UPI003B52E79B